MTLTTDYKDELFERLSNPKYAAGYLSSCAAEGQQEFLLGLRHVTEALGGVAQLSENTELNAKTLYRTLSEDGNPRLSSLYAILDAVGLQLTCVPAK
jgi:probable addiction module antidote protein